MSENTIDLTGNKTALALVSTIKAAVNGAGKYEKYVAEMSVTRDNLADHARALAALAYPNAPQVQKKDGKRTVFGNAVQAAGAGLRVALGEDMTKKPVDWIKMVKQAAENAANKGEVSPDAILAAVTETLAMLNTGE